MTSPNLHAILTPPGAGGIAVLVASGPDVLDLLARIFRPGRLPSPDSPSTAPRFQTGKLYYGHVLDEDRPIDEVIVAVLDPSSSPNALPCIEINCHGGTIPVRAVSDLLARLGVPRVDPDCFTRLQSPPSCDSIRFEAETLALKAVTRLAARHLFWQAAGVLSDFLRSCLHDLDAGPEPRARALQRLRDLLQSAPFGIGLSQPRTVTIVGLPNVGKSSLANMLVGSDRSLVHHAPGTTRDAVASLVSLAGVPLRIVDTAGLRPALDEVEAAGVRISLAKLRSADLVLWVFDHSRPLEPVESSHLQLLAGKPLLCVVNKMDLAGGLPEALLAAPFGADPVHTCALTGVGRPELESRILAALFGPRLPAVGEPLLFTQPLRDLVSRLLSHPANASAELTSLLGPLHPQD